MFTQYKVVNELKIAIFKDWNFIEDKILKNDYNISQKMFELIKISFTNFLLTSIASILCIFYLKRCILIYTATNLFFV